jgi:2-methylcitrate dehydratase PrpD
VPKFDAQVKQVGSAAQGIVEISTKQGKTYRRQSLFMHGSPEDPMSREEMMDKFKECVSYSVKPLSEKAA